MITITVNDNKYVGMNIGNYNLDRKVTLSEGEFSIMPAEQRTQIAGMVANNILTVDRNGNALSVDMIASGDFIDAQPAPAAKSNGVSAKKVKDIEKSFNDTINALTKRIEALESKQKDTNEISLDMSDLKERMGKIEAELSGE